MTTFLALSENQVQMAKGLSTLAKKGQPRMERM